MNIDEIVAKALTKSTLLDALSFACDIECERAMDQRINRPGTAGDGKQWDTFFRYIIKTVTIAWLNRSKEMEILQESVEVLSELSVNPEDFDFGPAFSQMQLRKKNVQNNLLKILRTHKELLK